MTNTIKLVIGILGFILLVIMWAQMGSTFGERLSYLGLFSLVPLLIAATYGRRYIKTKLVKNLITTVAVLVSLWIIPIVGYVAYLGSEYYISADPEIVRMRAEEEANHQAMLKSNPHVKCFTVSWCGLEMDIREFFGE